MNVLAPGRARNYALLALAAIGLLAWAALAVPNLDDGTDGHMILGSPPYYNEPHGIYFPNYKPLTTLLLPLRFAPHPWAFMLAATLHVMLIGASSWLTYKVARRYVPESTAALSAALVLFALVAHSTFMPVRPEGVLLATLLAVVYLCDTWRLDGKALHLAIACGLTGALALPMHPNASIIYIYLALFAIWQRRRLTRRDWVIAVGTLTASTIVGLTIVLVPHPSHLIELIRHNSGQERYTFVIGEVRRFLYLMRPAPLLPLTMFLGAAGLAAIALERPPLARVRLFATRYWGVLIVAVAAFVGLAFLLSAEWPHYLVFYFPALCILAALAYYRRPPLWVAIATGAAMLAVTALEVPVITAMRGGLREWMVVGLVYSAIATPMLCWSWYGGSRRWLFAALALGFVVVLGLKYADRVAFDDISRAVRETAQEVGAQQVFATPHFIWVFHRSEYEYVTMPFKSSDETPTLNNAVAPLFDDFYVRAWLARASDSCVIDERRRAAISGYVSNKLRGEGDYWTIAIITCEESGGRQ